MDLIFGLTMMFLLGMLATELIHFMVELRKEGKQLESLQPVPKIPTLIENSSPPEADPALIENSSPPEADPEPFTYWYICICGYTVDEKPRERMNSWAELTATGKTGHFDPCPECGQVDGAYERVSARKLPNGKLERAGA